MRTLVRGLIWLAVVIWVGGLFFFPIVAAISFSHLTDTHVAGSIVGACLRILHQEGLIAGGLMIILLVVAGSLNIFSRRSSNAVLLLTIIMLALTAYSQFSIIPRMEAHRIAAGGAIDLIPETDPNRVGFNHLHRESERVEEGVLVLGIVVIVLLARAAPKVIPAS